MIAVINYKMGNLQSVINALRELGEDAVLIDSPEKLSKARAIIIPGVGAFGEAMENLKNAGFLGALNEEVLVKKKPFLGICLGMQLIAKESFEDGRHRGLGWIDFTVKRMAPTDKKFRIPHMGWNNLEMVRGDSRLLRGLEKDASVYFVHSYGLQANDNLSEGYVTSVCWHGERIVASIEKDNIFGVQFHPEKSQNSGLLLLKNFINLANQC